MHFVPRLLRKRIAVHVLTGKVHEARPERGIAGDQAGFGERLELPDLRPLLEVALVRAEPPREWASISLGAQSCVDAERAPFCGAVADRADELRRNAFCVGEVRCGRAVVHEDDVDVGRVGELGAAEPAETDHREGQRRFERPQRPSTHVSARLESSRPTVSSSAKPNTSRAADAQELAALEPPETRSACGIVLARVKGVERFAHEVGSRLLRSEGRVVAERVDELRLSVHRVAEHARRAEDPAGALGGERRVVEPPGERGAPVVALGQPPEREQPEVGVG